MMQKMDRYIDRPGSYALGVAGLLRKCKSRESLSSRSREEDGEKKEKETTDPYLYNLLSNPMYIMTYHVRKPQVNGKEL